MSIYKLENRDKKHLLSHVIAQEFHSHSSTIKHSKQSTPSLSAVFDYIKYQIYSASLSWSESTNQPFTLYRGWYK